MSKTSVLVRILLAGSAGNASSAAWVDAAAGGGGYGGLSREEYFELDCMYRSLLRMSLQPRHWHALIARYSLDLNERGRAIKEVGKVIATHAHQHFKFYAVLTWAEKQRPGAEGRRSSAVLQSNIYDMTLWDDNHGTPERTRRHWRARIHEALDGNLDDAIAAACAVLDAEGLFDRIAA